ncbi:ATP-binding protein [Pelagicoccus sp. SDUM812003]|uniref:ATP-binding protein n=1 Tax=Pelagicoccus sp. SDUM812003 TaxID=3041267 RepID=UPI00280C9376|nr:ATP-binding protein [Pelagicoccus sp. SDUM812003]MDQ8202841.1 ATP-binding protein [Pelagicoccus sp. SDUM812003]
MNPSKSNRYFSFQTKVLVPVLFLLIALPAGTVYLVNQHVQKMTLEEAQDQLATAEAVLLNSLEIHSRSRQIQFKNAVNEPRFKAVSQLDEETMRSYLRNLFREFEADVLALVYTPIDGSEQSLVRRDTTINLSTFADTVADSIDTALGGELSADYYAINESLFNVISVPAFLTNAGYPVGCLTIGIKLGDQPISELKALTRAELAFVSDRSTLGTSLSGQQELEALQLVSNHGGRQDKFVQTALLNGEHFHLLTNQLQVNSSSSPPIRYTLLTSYEKELLALSNTRNLLLAISLGGISASVFIIWILIRRITSPLRALKRGAEAVGRGDFSQRVDCQSNDECGALAGAFNVMTTNLQSSRRDLENTVSELRETQAQLLQRESRLRESEEGLRLIIEGARDHVIFTLDDHGRPLRWNSAAERMLGYSSEEANALEYSRLFHSTDLSDEAPEELLIIARRTGQASFEGWRVRKDGTRFWADVTLSRLAKVDGSETGGFVEIARDITARKEAEEALRKARDAAESSDRAKSEFLANMSHEFRTPMNGIIGMAGLLSSLELSEEQSEYVETIRYSADSLLAIIDDILDIAKIEAGQLEISTGPINLIECVEETVQLFAPDCAKKGLELHLVIAPGVPGIVDTDASRLRQVLVNLIGNAIKFTKSGGAIVSVDYEHSQQKLAVSIEDTGIGIPPEKIRHLFDPFYQVESSASRQYGGTGLGLTITRNIVSLLGGRVTAQSEAGKGSRFSFTIKADAIETVTTLAPISGRNVLVITDSELAWKALQAQLGFWSMSSRRCRSNPDQVTRSLVENEFDLLIVDPSATRLDTIRALIDCQERSKGAFPPFIRLLSLDTEDELTPCVNSQAIRTPARPTALHRSMCELVLGGPSRQTTELPIFIGPSDSEPAREPAVAPKPEPEAEEKSSQEQKPSKSSPRKGYDSDFATKHPLRLLVVEDNAINTKVLVKLLKKLGYAPDTAENGQEGLKAAESIRYDAILMDLQMPVMDGLESARRILASDLIEHPVYISAFTANARQSDQEDCIEAGMHDFVAKPARVEAVTGVLERAHSWIQDRLEV